MPGSAVNYRFHILLSSFRHASIPPDSFMLTLFLLASFLPDSFLSALFLPALFLTTSFLLASFLPDSFLSTSFLPVLSASRADQTGSDSKYVRQQNKAGRTKAP